MGIIVKPPLSGAGSSGLKQAPSNRPSINSAVAHSNVTRAKTISVPNTPRMKVGEPVQTIKAGSRYDDSPSFRMLS